MHVSGLDLLDGTPILDIKPYVPTIDQAEADRIGWLEGRVAAFHTSRADDRFDGQ